MEKANWDIECTSVGVMECPKEDVVACVGSRVIRSKGRHASVFNGVDEA